jgi:hypothetical protein
MPGGHAAPRSAAPDRVRLAQCCRKAAGVPDGPHQFQVLWHALRGAVAELDHSLA